MRALKDQAALPSEKVGKEGVCPCAQFWIQPGHPCGRGRGDSEEKLG
jgi:hypothetical protein